MKEKEIVMKIKDLRAHRIFDSRGVPAVECELILDNGSSYRASSPSGKSRGKAEAVEKRDGGNSFAGMDVTGVIYTIEHTILNAIKGVAPEFITIDTLLCELDGTENKSHLGANALLPVSIAVLRAQAALEGIAPYELIAHATHNALVGLPMPMFNVINGGVHTNNSLSIQEFMVIPRGASHYATAIEGGLTVYQALKNILIKDGKSVAVGDEGGFAPVLKDEHEALDYLMRAIDVATKIHGFEFNIALDMASSEWYSPNTTLYTYQGKQYDNAELIDMYATWCNEYPIISLEDGLAQSDWIGWQQLTKRLGDRICLVGDDIFATNADLIYEGIELSVGNGVLIKPNQRGTVTETLQSIMLCNQYERVVQISHRSGETNDTFIADLAVGVKAPFIKAGAPARGERIAKYNRLLELEELLMMSE